MPQPPEPARPSPADYAQSAGFATSLQDVDGAFAWTPTQPADLGATSTALRIYSECAAEVPHLEAVRDYVHACFDPATSGFALTPGGSTTLHSIAEGHVALVKLGDTGERWTHHLLDLVSGLVRTPMDIWIASAFLNTIGLRPPSAREWADSLLDHRNADGSWGHKDDGAVETAIHASSFLLLGIDLPDRPAVADILLSTQLGNGGWSDAGSSAEGRGGVS